MKLAVQQPFDLEATLVGGQAHRWRADSELSDADGDWFSGVIRGNFVKIRQTSQGVEFISGPAPEADMIPVLQDYLRLDDDLEQVYAEICRDDRVAAMVDRYPGLRILRQEPWECLVAYVCSANNSIRQIHNNMEAMAGSMGEPVSLGGDVRCTFPSPAQLIEAGEQGLRDLKLGFRAPNVHQVTRRVLERSLDLDELIAMPYGAAKEKLMESRGIGAKIANCILLFSLEKSQAFPVDVWVRRALAEWYFPGQKPPTNPVLEQWAHGYFGNYAGYANQYLFHGRRLAK